MLQSGEFSRARSISVRPAKEIAMKNIKLAALALCAGVSLTLAQAQPFQAGQDMKDAGHDTADATKTVAHKTATGTKTAAKDTGHGTKVAAKDTAHGTTVAAKDTAHGTKVAADKTADVTKEGADKTASGTKHVVHKVEGKPSTPATTPQ